MPEIDTNWPVNRQEKLSGFSALFKEDILEVHGDLTVSVKPDRIRDMIGCLKERLGFEMLMDLFGMDYLKWEPPTLERFAVIYNLYSLSQNKRVHVKVYVSETKPEIDSIWDIYKAANWFEREAYDMFGIVFKGHPNLQRILCHQDFVGHPLRKDYPADKYQRLKTAAPSTGL